MFINIVLVIALVIVLLLYLSEKQRLRQYSYLLSLFVQSGLVERLTTYLTIYSQIRGEDVSALMLLLSSNTSETITSLDDKTLRRLNSLSNEELATIVDEVEIGESPTLAKLMKSQKYF